MRMIFLKVNRLLVDNTKDNIENKIDQQGVFKSRKLLETN